MCIRYKKIRQLFFVVVFICARTERASSFEGALTPVTASIVPDERD